MNKYEVVATLEYTTEDTPEGIEEKVRELQKQGFVVQTREVLDTAGQYKAINPAPVDSANLRLRTAAIQDGTVPACDYDGRDCTGICGLDKGIFPQCPLKLVYLSTSRMN
jgi:hypothetical protein